MKAKEKISLIFKLVIIILGVCALVTEITHTNNPIVLFYFFTVLMNVVCIITFGLLVFKNKLQLTAWRGGITAGTLLVMLIFHFVMRPTSEYYGDLISFFDMIFHYVIPCAAVLDFIFFTEHGRMRWFHPIWWLGFPISYMIFVFIRAAVGQPFSTGYGESSYPYFFLDVSTQGLAVVVISILVILGFYLVLGYAIMGLDRLCIYVRRKVEKRIQPQ